MVDLTTQTLKVIWIFHFGSLRATAEGAQVVRQKWEITFRVWAIFFIGWVVRHTLTSYIKGKRDHGFPFVNSRLEYLVLLQIVNMHTLFNLTIWVHLPNWTTNFESLAFLTLLIRNCKMWDTLKTVSCIHCTFDGKILASLMSFGTLPIFYLFISKTAGRRVKLTKNFDLCVCGGGES